MAVWWKEGVELDFLVKEQNHIHLQVCKGLEPLRGFVTLAYGPPTEVERRSWWPIVKTLCPSDGSPWLCFVDFNDLLSPLEKDGGNHRTSSSFAHFQNFLKECELFDLGAKGLQFTWTNRRQDDAFIRERLDRAICNGAWRELCPTAQVCNLKPLGSDHSPLLIQLEYVGFVGKREFKFEPMWIDHAEYNELIIREWGGRLNQEEGENPWLIGKLVRLRSVLIDWSKKVFPNNKVEIQRLLNVLKECYEGERGELDRSRVEEVERDINLLWEREEKYWFQRSRVSWLKWGDENSSFFHKTTIQRRARNKIVRVRNDIGDWVEDREGIGNCFSSFYHSLFTKSGRRNLDRVLSYVAPKVSDQDNVNLLRPIGDLEIKQVVHELGGVKAPGPDGYHGVFYQQSWEVVQQAVIGMVQDFFAHRISMRELNQTNLVLLPKVDVPESVGHFRPISLCNFSYKVISKIIANRMRSLMPQIITKQQRAFVPGRQIQDNIFIVHEAFHHLKRSKSTKEMAIKIDMNKAYDRVEWDFLEALLERLRFDRKWVDYIMACLTTVEFNLKLEGQTVDTFKPGRGLRQGDPLSPYLFIMVADVLSNMVNEHIRRGDLHGIRITKHCPEITHCFFADDSLFFTQANHSSSVVLKSIWEEYCEASGQRINWEKSSLFMSDTTPADTRLMVSETLGIPCTSSPGNYLAHAVGAS